MIWASTEIASASAGLSRRPGPPHHQGMTAATKKSPTKKQTDKPADPTFTVGYRDLVQALATTKAAVHARPIVPVLGRVLIRCNPAGTVDLTTFDYEIAVTAQVQADVTAPGTVLVGHQELSKVLTATGKGTPKAELDTATVTVAVDKTGCVLHVGGFAIPMDTSIAVSDFPALPAAPAATDVVDRAGFTDLAGRVGQVAGKTDFAPVLNTVKVELAGDRVTLTATDRYRLATGWVPTRSIDRSDRADRSVLIHAGALKSALAGLRGHGLAICPGPAAGTDWVFLLGDGVTVGVRTADGDYPKTDSLLDGTGAGGQITITVDRDRLLAYATRAAAIDAALENSKILRLTVSASGLTLTPRAVEAQAPVTAPQLDADVTGDTGDRVWGINPKYLLDAAASTGTERVTVHLSERGIIGFTGEQEPLAPGSTYRHIVMTVRSVKSTTRT